MGTYYNITAELEQDKRIKQKVDSLLVQINNSLSTYIQTSTINQFNNDFSSFEKSFSKGDILYQYFIDNLLLSYEIHEKTKGAYDATVMPLVNYWGFGYEGRNRIDKVDSIAIKALLAHVGMEKVRFDGQKVEKASSFVELDFSALAKGYAVDQISKFLEEQGAENYYVDIGADLFAKGVNPRQQKWRTGINVPSESSSITDFQEIIELSDKGIATSGNYRNYYETADGRKYAHTINPFTGYTERNDLLSATIIADNCARADGFATAAMVLGLEGAKTMISSNENVEGILIYTDKDGNFQTFKSF